MARRGGAEELTSLWARFGAELTYDDLPEQARRTVRDLTLDTLGVALAANTLGVGVPQLLAWARTAGGAPQASLIGLPDALPAASAAMVNGGMAHALNFDDTTAVGSGHLGPVTLPTALAAAELRGGVSGKEFMAALAAGMELMARIGASLAAAGSAFTESKPQPTQMPGCFAAAMSASRALGFTPQETHSALGLAFMQASGGRQPVLEGRPAKAVYAAFSCHAGMLSALLSREGLLGDCDAFEGEAGFFPTYYGGAFHRPVMSDGLGGEWLLLNTGLKPWPTTGVAHVFIEAAANIRAAHSPPPSAVARVLVRGEPHIRTFCEPLQVRRNPRSPVEAEDSVIFATARALVAGGVALADLQPTAQGLFDESVLRVANRTEYEVDESLGKSGVVEVTLESGETFSARMDAPRGHRDNPLTDGQRRQKFRDCAIHAGTPLDDRAVGEVIAVVESLDDLPDVGALLPLLRGERRASGGGA